MLVKAALKAFITIALLIACYPVAAYQIDTKQTIHVVGDIHGAYNEIHQTLNTLKLIDTDDNWIGAQAHFVSLGDLMDRGYASRKVIDLFIKLQQQAKQAGGGFHVVLGNHEVMNLVGDRRYLSKQEIAEFAADETEAMRQQAYQNYLIFNKLQDSPATRTQFEKQYPAGYFAHQQAFSADGQYGQWLLSLPFVIQINDQIFTHGGISRYLYKQSIEDVNRDYKQALSNYLKSWQELVAQQLVYPYASYHDKPDLVAQLEDSNSKQVFQQAARHLLFTSVGPTWYRGNVLCHPFYEHEITTFLLKQWDANRLWVGHTTTPDRKIHKRFDGLLYVMDTGMLNDYYKGTPYAAVFKGNKQPRFVNGLTGTAIEPVTAPVRQWSAPYNMSRQQIEAFLKTANVLEMQHTEDGVTKPLKLTLAKDGKTMHALFKYEDTHPKLEQDKSSMPENITDRYKNELAAYHIDQLLGLNMVPITVERKIDYKHGSVQLWIDNLVSELKMKEQGIPYQGICDQKDQLNMMDIFDYLIQNVDRNQSNVMYSQDDWQLWFIDHSRSFDDSTRRPKMLRNAKMWVTPQFKQALQSIDYDSLQALQPWLHNRQIRGILKRSKKLIKGSH